MNREVHARICERLGVKFPGPTRQLRSSGLQFLCKLDRRPDDATAGSVHTAIVSTHYRSAKSFGNSSLVSSLNMKFAKTHPVLVILKLNRK